MHSLSYSNPRSNNSSPAEKKEAAAESKEAASALLAYVIVGETEDEDGCTGRTSSRPNETRPLMSF